MKTDNLTKSPDSKIYWIECIRVFSAFLVVMQHSISGVWTTLSPETPEWKIINIVFLFSRCAVPVFFMCSGMGMLAKQRSIESIFRKNIWGILKIYVLWMLVYGVRDSISLIREGLGSFRTVRNAFLKDIIFGQYHTWFIMALIGLYLITPLLYEIVKKEKLLNYFLVLSVLFTVILPLAGEIGGFERLSAAFETFHMKFVTGYVMYYVLGYRLSRITWPHRQTHAFSWKGRSFFASYTISRKKAGIFTALLLALSALAAFIISSMVSARSGEAIQTVYGEFAPLGLIVNASLLMLFKTGITSEKHRKLIFKLGSCGTGIYLMHPLLLPIASHFPGISRIFGGIVVYLTALVICLIIGKAESLFRKQA